ncbi:MULTISPECIES: 5'-methylthioadenosine/adenosylhomocysteine nucleosidase [unclassified Bacteroides]|jgi:adenosylhomocysteine nucleosidase|uniref:5'-methylthioadenosine/adenosylhomocysteine nucleosidase n=1 Tax=unclassified Bacteroides TaxID=2646097 RepID=UPI000E8F7C88|nr:MULTISPECIES: 5'-methylthioadenosine/adenosylhomocysteine nucleosidase [unclassified Bacteroides]RGN51442.1 5'-methylthioadenosine/adenosylhomocysteine nucleosidase [Bacteroides sp. OM05-12]RHR78029.1 5'-methylthioadenosine/adenosylhomocysteine nucleosidase [Bacteroides sp. AF16-49]
MKLGIITAMGSEYDQLAQLLADKVEQNEGRHQYITGHLGDNELVLMQCGIGKVNAAAGTADLIHAHHPDCIISTGVAGGIDKCLKVMEVVVSSRIVYHDVWCGEGNAYGQVQGLPLYFEGNRTLLDCALGLASETRIHDGLICTGDKFITDRTELNEIKKQFPDGLAVDMESGAIAHVCYLNKISFISFRIISDTPGVDHHFEQYLNFWGEMADRSFGVTHAFLSALPNKL